MELFKNYKKRYPTERMLVVEPIGPLLERQLTKKDVNALVDIIATNFIGRYVSKSAYSRVLKNKSYVYLGYYHKGRLIAVLGLQFKRNDMYIANIVVDEKHRGHGLATELLTRAFYVNAMAHGLLKPKSTLHVFVDNEPAKKVYHRLGYKQVKKHDRFYRNGDSAYSMVKSLVVSTKEE